MSPPNDQGNAAAEQSLRLGKRAARRLLDRHCSEAFAVLFSEFL